MRRGMANGVIVPRNARVQHVAKWCRYGLGSRLRK